mmetsp:Transcript_79435/g.227973  ORF Transcript_79435/g.227973 Transcript_79435/m.227973 type:complete len:223 (-) Transcript_79435:697-1365(-)
MRRQSECRCFICSRVLDLRSVSIWPVPVTLFTAIICWANFKALAVSFSDSGTVATDNTTRLCARSQPKQSRSSRGNAESWPAPGLPIVASDASWCWMPCVCCLSASLVVLSGLSAPARSARMSLARVIKGSGEPSFSAMLSIMSMNRQWEREAWQVLEASRAKLLCCPAAKTSQSSSGERMCARCKPSQTKVLGLEASGTTSSRVLSFASRSTRSSSEPSVV